MGRLASSVFLVLGIASLVGVQLLAAGEVSPVVWWEAHADDPERGKLLPPNGIVTTGNTFRSLWKNWDLGGPVPEVNFETHVVIVDIFFGGNPSFRTTTNEKGDLKVQIDPETKLGGVSCLIFVLPRAEVKSFRNKDIGPGEMRIRR